MLYSFELTEIPKIKKFYTVTRNTVWQIAENEDILIFIENGSCEISCDGESHILEKGNIFFIPAKHTYLRKPINDATCTMIYIHFTLSAEVVQENTRTLADKLNQKKKQLDSEILCGETHLSYSDTIYLNNKNTIKNYDSLFELLKNINQFSTNRQLTCNLQSSITLCSILVNLTQSTLDIILTDTSISNHKSIPPKLRRAISYIMRHYSEQITLEQLSDFCNISKQQLIRYFRAAFDTTPINYITEYKLARAKDMLFNFPQLSIKEIAAELGFDNQHYFSRVFTKVNGETPSQYRNRTVYYVQNTNK